MATLRVSQTTDFTGQSFNPKIDVIDFTNSVGNGHLFAVASFTASQFDNVNISVAVTLDGSSGVNSISINDAQNFDASGWTFANWSASGDFIAINGNAGSNSLKGSLQRDTVNGGDGGDTIRGLGGADSLHGDSGNDTFLYSAGEVAAAEVIDGGGDTDQILLTGDGTFNFFPATIISVETLRYGNLISAVALAGSQIGGAGGLVEIVGNLSADALTVTGAAINLSGVIFTDWNDGADRIDLIGSVDADTIVGGKQADNLIGVTGDDILNGGGGGDTLSGGVGGDMLIGGGGNDSFVYESDADLSAGESLDGGAGKADRIVLDTNFGGAVDFLSTAINGIESLVFLSAGLAQFDEFRIGSASGKIHSVTGSAEDERLDIFGSTTDLSGVSFKSWSAADTINLFGDASGGTYTGSAKNDSIFGRGGRDIETGGKGADLFVFLAETESGVDAQRDVITDFGNGGDIIDLLAIDAIGPGGSSNDAFTFIGKAAFTGTAGQLRYAKNNGADITVISGDTDGDGDADFQIELTGAQNLQAADFVL